MKSKPNNSHTPEAREGKREGGGMERFLLMYDKTKSRFMIAKFGECNIVYFGSCMELFSTETFLHLTLWESLNSREMTHKLLSIRLAIQFTALNVTSTEGGMSHGSWSDIYTWVMCGKACSLQWTPNPHVLQWGIWTMCFQCGHYCMFNS